MYPLAESFLGRRWLKIFLYPFWGKIQVGISHLQINLLNFLFNREIFFLFREFSCCENSIKTFTITRAFVPRFENSRRKFSSDYPPRKKLWQIQNFLFRFTDSNLTTSKTTQLTINPLSASSLSRPPHRPSRFPRQTRWINKIYW